MTDFIQSLQSRDLSYLRIVAESWDISIEKLDARSILQHLSVAIKEPLLVQEVVDSLPSEARAALDDLINSNGRLSWPVFTRNYGAVREMGPGRRDREQPYRNATLPAEMLWYRGLVARAFFDTPDGPQEFAYIPEDLLAATGSPAGAAPGSRGFSGRARPNDPGRRCYFESLLYLSCGFAPRTPQFLRAFRLCRRAGAPAARVARPAP